MTTWGKVFLALTVALAAISLADFILYGNHVRDLLVALGFALMSYGTYKNSGRSRPDSDNDPSFDKYAHYASIAGVTLALVGIISGYVM